MSTVSMRVDVAGSDGIPHTFLVVTHPDGRVVEYGFAPKVTGVIGLGEIFITGPGTEHRAHEYQFQGPTHVLNDIQHQKLMENINRSIANPPYYVVTGPWTPGGGTNCTGWAVNVWNNAGLPNTLGATNSWVWNPYGQAMILSIHGLVNTVFSAARNWTPPRDPLVLDLDNDGIEAVGINPATPILFDHDGDGTKNATGWIKSDDGIVVRDLNGNGVIDSGRELFGDNTVLTRGLKAGQTAANGFEAIADLDINDDGILNSSDAAYTQLRVWQDTNQDAISQVTELKTLSQLGISSINVTGTASNINLGNGNTQPFTGSFTRTNGTTGTSGVAEVTGSLLLASNNFYREFTDDPAISASAAELPEMHGSGMVRDLRAAMSLGNPDATALQTKLGQYSAATTRDEQLALLDQLIQAWGATSSMPTSIRENRTVAWRNEMMGNPYAPTVIQEFAQANPILFAKINALEQFNGTNLLSARVLSRLTGPVANIYSWLEPLSAEQDRLINQAYDSLKQSVYDGLVLQTRLSPYLDSIDLEIDENGLHFDTTVLSSNIEAKVNSNSRTGIIDLVDLTLYATSTLLAVGYDSSSALRAKIAALPAGSPLLAELATLHVLQGAASGTSTGDIYLGDAASSSFNGEAGNDVIDGDAGNDLLQGGAGNDTLIGGAGDDTLAGGIYDTWNGNYSGAGNDTYLFGRGDGQDRIVDDDATVGNIDKIVFKAGVAVSDVQVVREGDFLFLKINGTTDRIRVDNYFSNDGATSWQIEEVRFTDAPATVWRLADIKAKAILGTSVGETLVGYASADSINGGDGEDTISGRDGNDTLNGGNDGDAMYGEGGDDTLNGEAGGDMLQGGAGNDTLNGGAGDDTLAGGVYDGWNGNYSGAGNDTYLFGRGDGQDRIVDDDATVGNIDKIVFKAGVAVSDVAAVREGDFLFLKINGTTDRIRVDNYFANDGASSWRIEEVRFTDAPGIVWTLADIKAKAILGTSVGETLVGYASADSINGGDGEDTISGRDGNDTLNGGNDGDALYGEGGDDTLNGEAGGDMLQGGAGNDTLNGGAGDDTLAGGVYDGWNGNYSGAGNDTYLFGRGDGQDRIVDDDATVGNIDKIVFKAGVAVSDVQAVREGDFLFLKINGTTDRIRVDNYFANDGASSWRIEEVRFTDAPGIVWTLADIKAKAILGTSVGETLVGYASADTINGGDGEDTISGRDGNDTLNGGNDGDALYGEGGDDTLNGDAGNDLLQGGAGNDTLNGGAGDDTLAGGVYDGWNGNYSGAGNDTYLFGRGDGQDRIVDDDATVGNIDKIVFKAGVAVSDVQAVREGDFLFLKINGTTDRIRVDNYFSNDGATSWAIEEVRFTDAPAVVWTITQLRALVAGALSPIVAAPLADQAATENSAFSWNVPTTSFTDADSGTALTYAARLEDGGALPSWLTFDPATRRFLGTPGTAAVGSLQIRVIVTDPQGLSTSDVFALTVTGAPVGPIVGTPNADTLTGTTGADTMLGGAGNDTYVVNHVGDVVTENASEGTDLIQASVTHTLAANVENLTLTGTAAINGTGNAQANVIRGNAGNNVLDGGDGNDTMYGGAGNDTFIVAVTADLVFENANEGTDLILASTTYELGLNTENLTLTGTAAIDAIGNTMGNVLTGNTAANTLTGKAGNDTLDGLAGNDSLLGGVGNDVYRFGRGDGQDSIADGDATAGNVDQIVFKTGVAVADVQAVREGDALVLKIAGTTDQVRVAGYFTNNGVNNALIEEIRFTDAPATVWNYAQILAKVAPVIVGTTGNDTLTGTTGADTMLGGAGNDTYVVDHAGDVVTENPNEGTDLVQASVSTTLTANVENLTLTGTAAINATGNALANTIRGNAGNNVLDGGDGNDSMYGGAGDDTYFVAVTADLVIELANQGTDLVLSSTTYELGPYTEKLTLTGTAAIDAIGNTIDNVLTGNAAANTLTGKAGNDTLDGGAGADTLVGGTGDDTYVVDNAADVVTEALNEGTDLVQSSVTHTLAANVENLTLTGSAAINATGNALANVIRGNAGANTLDGGDGNDTMYGGAGNDTYVVAVTTDLVFENANEGTDLILASTTYELGLNTENLTLTGASAIDAIGNTMANVLTGNAAANTLTGKAGNDTLDGGAGADTLVGGTGNDTYLLRRGDGADLVTENDATAGNTDVASFGTGIATDQLWFRQIGNDLEVSVIGTGDRMNIGSWYLGNAYHLEQFKTSDGKTLLDSQVQNLVQAMAQFAPPAAGQTTLAAGYATTLQPVIAANWQ